jgi:hypothetical protein
VLKKLLASVGLGVATATAAQLSTHAPYKDEATNRIYNLLFCDSLALYRANHEGSVSGPWQVLFADRPDPKALGQLAVDPNAEARIRLLAFNSLRGTGTTPKAKQLLGVVIEVGLPGGLDTLAAYRDGTARYINQTGKLVLWDARDPAIGGKISRLMASSEKVVAKLKPWGGNRRSPPTAGNIRLTFLASDGLYFGEGPAEALQQDPMGGPVIASGLDLLLAMTGRLK